MGKIIDTAEVDHVSVGTLDGEEFYVITFKNSFGGLTEGRMLVDEDFIPLNQDIWKPGIKVIASWEESEWDGARVNIISDEMFNAWRNDSNKWRELTKNMSKEQLDELDWLNHPRTDRQIEISHYD